MAKIRKLRGRWQAMIRRKGMAPRAKSFDNKSDAERWARYLESELDRCGSLPNSRVAERTSLSELLRRYLAEVTPHKRSARTEQLRIQAILRRDICHRSLAQLSSNDLAVYRDERLKQVAPATVRRELNTISHAIDIARREWDLYLVQNPVKLVRRPIPPKGRNRRLEAGEEQRLLDAADSCYRDYMRPIILLAIETGMRRGEMLSLQWSDVDLDRRDVHLALTKNGEARDVPLSIRATQMVRSLPRTTGSVFDCSETAVWQSWCRIRKRAGLEDLHFHDLRHEAISRLFEKGLGIIEVCTISGHKELKMLQRYTHLRAEDLVSRLG